MLVYLPELFPMIALGKNFTLSNNQHFSAYVGKKQLSTRYHLLIKRTNDPLPGFYNDLEFTPEIN